MPPEPPKTFFILNMLQNSFAEKLRSKYKSNLGASLPEKNSDYALDMNTFFKGLIYAFFGSNFFRLS